jgi:hypothetical protein
LHRGIRQRGNIALNLPIVNALVDTVLLGQTLYPKGGLEVYVRDTNSAKLLKISHGTLNSWITRGNVISETGEPLKAVLGRAREQYRVNKEREKHLVMVQWAEKQCLRVLNLRTSQPVRNIFGHVVKRENGSVVRRENVNLLKIKIDIAKFVLETLEPAVYGKR